MSLTMNILLSGSKGLFIYCIMILDRMGVVFIILLHGRKGGRAANLTLWSLHRLSDICDIPNTNLLCVFFFTIVNMVWLLSLPKQLHFLWARSANNPPQLVCRLPEVQIKTNPFATYTNNIFISILTQKYMYFSHKSCCCQKHQYNNSIFHQGNCDGCIQGKHISWMRADKSQWSEGPLKTE